MDDSPRSSKRRKIETSACNGSSPVADKSSLKRVSSRIATRTASLTTIESLDENSSFIRKRKTANNTPNTRSRRRDEEDEKDVDVYDDFEGALESPISEKNSHQRRGVDKTSSAPHPSKSSRRTEPKKLDPTGELFSRLREKENKRLEVETKSIDAPDNVEAEFNLESAIQRDLDAQQSTLSGHKKGAKRTSGLENGSAMKKKESPATTGRRKTRRAVETDDDDNDELQQPKVVEASTPLRAQSIRARGSSSKAVANTANGIDEIAPMTPSRKSTQRHPVPKEQSAYFLPVQEVPKPARNARARRAANLADHTYNEDDIVPIPDTEDTELYVQLNDPGDGHSDIDGSSMLDPTEPSPFNVIRKEPVAAPIMHAEPISGHGLDLLKKIVMERITGKRPAPLVGLDADYQTVHQLVEHTVTAGEGNSMLLIGARGSGKTTLVNQVLSEVAKDNAEEFHVVRLNGFVHTDDKVALREIWRQLGKEMDLEEENGGIGKNYADTLTTLLALLSHPSEHTGQHTEQVAKAVIFILDEFDLFAMHPRQTLLYNLFDIAQSRKAPIAVLGLTTRIDVADSLEKRVKSRFSHRYIHLSLAKSFTAFQEICKASLIIEPNQLSTEEASLLSATPKLTPNKKSKKPPSSRDVLSEWNLNISALFASTSFLTTFLAPHYYRTKSPSAVLTSFLLPTATLTAPAGPLSTTSPSSSPSAPGPLTSTLHPPDSKLSLLPHLSTLSLSLLIAAARLDIIHDSDTCNFNMAYDEYVALASKAKIAASAGGAVGTGSTSKVWGKEVARREWEGLVEGGLVLPVLGGVGGGGGGFAMVKCDVSLEEIGEGIRGLKDKTMDRWCRQI
ncbi:hypothetical protein GQ43DRAFT_415738 [Delitschia confertaspora ATCC 74209]|uniref:Origin recognition complex subunit 4 n=1 Tax=Delitschia confertaspora ATCC 74209 TaxID=1513339 RepID=A0A9P4JLF6_9PLEO|nr:hypothetical protein GQ43DRAFT_415738 [Delitschia confertaspora ATCC 74209]